MKGSDIPSKSLVTAKKGNITSIYKKGKKDDPGNYRPVSLISVLGEIMKQIFLVNTLRNMENREMI